MSDIFLHNTLSGKKEKFKPLKKGEVSMYHCGPTVYDYAHIGNLRAYVFADTLRRMFEFNGYKVKQVINVTDIGHLTSDADEGEDKMTKALKREGKLMTLEAMREVADFYFERFKEDLERLNIKMPDEFPFASDHIEEDKALIQKLMDRGFTYQTSDGIYFDTAKFPEYGKLGGSFSKDNEYSRIGVNTEKKNPRDFALWKFSAEGGSASGGNNTGYEAPWGKGFPGWHIECSAMSMKYLGETFDIHTGGIDHIPIHHNNEIAESEGATGKPFVHYWLHSAFLNISKSKMAKSAGNFTRLIDLIENNFSPLAYRLLLLQSHYRIPMSFSVEALRGTEEALQGLYRNLSSLPEGGKADKKMVEKFEEALNDDLNTPRAVAVLFETLKSPISPADKLATALKFDEVLGLKLKEGAELIKKEEAELPVAVKNLLAEREMARKNNQFDRADMLRAEINNLGYAVEDTATGPKVSKK